jgi:L-fucono-1,5-lactonase
VLIPTHRRLGNRTIIGMIIDTHTHFYDPTRPQGVPWPGQGDRLLNRKVLPEEYKKLAEPLGVTGTVVVEASPWLEDNQWVLDLADREPFIVGFVGHLTPGGDGVGQHLARFAKNRLFRGIRVGQGDIHQGLDSRGFLADVEALATHDLALDGLGGPAMLADVAKLAVDLPGLRIVIDHIGGGRIAAGPLQKDWLDGHTTVAKHANEFCKVSGLVEATGLADGKPRANPPSTGPPSTPCGSVWGRIV